MPNLIKKSWTVCITEHLLPPFFKNWQKMDFNQYRSWILTVRKVRIIQEKLLKWTFLAFKNGKKSIQNAGYNGARTVLKNYNWKGVTKAKNIYTAQECMRATVCQKANATVISTTLFHTAATCNFNLCAILRLVEIVVEY